jgi:hypothetical protein
MAALLTSSSTCKCCFSVQKQQGSLIRSLAVGVQSGPVVAVQSLEFPVVDLGIPKLTSSSAVYSFEL